MAPLRPLRIIPAWVPTLALLLALFAKPLAAESAAPPAIAAVRLAIAPIAREFFDGQEAMGESLTSLLLASLSDDPRWILVERNDLDALATEWALTQPGLAESVSAVTRGRLLGADWVLVLRPDLTVLEQPALQLEIIDAARAEPLASHHVRLRLRPRARWFRNPPADDFATVLGACRSTLQDAWVARASHAETRVAALLFLHPENQRGDLPPHNAPELENLIAHAVQSVRSAPGEHTWRLLDPLRPEVSRGEGLLRAAGFVAEGASVPIGSIADAFLWGRSEPDAAGLRLTFWIWPGYGAARKYTTLGSPADIARDVGLAVGSLPSPENSAQPAADTAAELRRLASDLIAEARSLAATTPPPSPPAAGTTIRRLLELAAFFQPADREIQELRILATLRSLPSDPLAPVSLPRIRAGLDYARLAEQFWRRPHDRYDLRLFAASFTFVHYSVPGQRERALRAAPILARMPPEALREHRDMLNNWRHYCLTPGPDSFTLLEAVLPLIARFSPARLRTPPNGGFVGWIPQLLETYEGADRVRLLALIDRLPAGPTDRAPALGGPFVEIENSPFPLLSSPPAPDSRSTPRQP